MGTPLVPARVGHCQTDDRALEPTSSVLSTGEWQTVLRGGGAHTPPPTTLSPFVFLALQQILGKQVQKNNMG